MLVIFSCSNVINDIILRRTARCPRGAIGACRLPLPRAPGATTAFHPRAPLTQRDRRFLPFDSTRTNANPPVFDAPPLLLAKTKGFASPPKIRISCRAAHSPFAGRVVTVLYTIPTNNVEAIENAERFA